MLESFFQSFSFHCLTQAGSIGAQVSTAPRFFAGGVDDYFTLRSSHNPYQLFFGFHRLTTHTHPHRYLLLPQRNPSFAGNSCPLNSLRSQLFQVPLQPRHQLRNHRLPLQLSLFPASTGHTPRHRQTLPGIRS